MQSHVYVSSTREKIHGSNKRWGNAHTSVRTRDTVKVNLKIEDDGGGCTESRFDVAVFHQSRWCETYYGTVA